MAMKVLQKHWNQSGKWDSLWAILTWDDKKGNKSDRNAPQTSSVRDEMTVSTDSVAQNVPLVVDLDGTLLRTDSLWESVLLLGRQRWYARGLIPVWLLRGKAYFKWRLADLVDLPAANLPYNEPFLTFLKAERARPRRLILATGANGKIAHAIASHLGLFDHVFERLKKLTAWQKMSP